MTDAFRRRSRCFTLCLLLASCMLICTAAAQGRTASSSPPLATASVDVPRFEVATIKPAVGNDGRIMMMMNPDGVSLHGIPMQMVLRGAFNVEDDRIVGAPGWVKSNRYDIEAKVDADDAPKLKDWMIEQRWSMLLPLLTERFNLKYHHETRELPMYALVIAKGGSKMKESKPNDPAAKDAKHTILMNRGNLESEGTEISFLVRTLSRQLGRTVVDKTGLTGNYDYTLQWTPDDAPPPAAGADGGPPHNDGGSDAVGPSLFTAVQEQLGLKLESKKGPVDVIVIDHLDLPSEN